MTKRLSSAAWQLRQKISAKKEKKEKEFDSWGRPIYKPLMGSEFYKTKEWQELRYKVLKESADKNGGRAKCELCGRSAPAVALNVDHKKPRKYFPSLELEKSNLQVLCEDDNQGKGSSL
jgi:5-methylcytosine-specific restriction endonuclease McrA